jgi:hypothetical protein
MNVNLYLYLIKQGLEVYMAVETQLLTLVTSELNGDELLALHFGLFFLHGKPPVSTG